MVGWHRIAAGDGKGSVRGGETEPSRVFRFKAAARGGGIIAGESSIRQNNIIMAPKKSKKKVQSPSPSSSSSTALERYGNMTLDELADLKEDDDDDGSDEEIDEDCAFDSDDERAYGNYFSSKSSLGGGKMIAMRGGNLSLSVPLEEHGSTLASTRSVVSVNVARGSRLTLSSLCLDVERWCDFDRIRVAYRCTDTPPGGREEKAGTVDDGFRCLANYLSAERGGAGLTPSTAVNLVAVGPCTVEFRPFVTPSERAGGGGGGGSVDIFGTVEPIAAVEPARALLGGDDGDSSSQRAADPLALEEEDGGIGSQEEEEEEDDVEEEDAASRDDDDVVVVRTDEGEGDEAATPKKDGAKKRRRKEAGAATTQDGGGDLGEKSPKRSRPSDTMLALQDAKQQLEGTSLLSSPASSDAAAASSGAAGDAEGEEGRHSPDRRSSHEKSAPATGDAGSAVKLTKKQRRKLAKEKTRQLEETLASARGDDDVNSEGGSSPKEEKKKKSSNNNEGRLIRERRIKGGIVVSDMLLGMGAPVKPGRRVSVHYTGKLCSTGKVFDKNNSKQHPLVFRQGTGEVIRGLERGLEGMRVGGERVIKIPSKLGYGSKGAGVDVPPDSDLVFEVKVLKVG